MNKIFLIATILPIVFLTACSKSGKNLDGVYVHQNTSGNEIIIEKQGTYSVENSTISGNIHSTQGDKVGTIKFHRFLIPSMYIAVYDINPNTPEVIIEYLSLDSNNIVEIPYYEVNTPLPNLITLHGGFIQMFTKDVNVTFENTIKSQNWKNILYTIEIDANIDLGDIDDLYIEKTDNHNLLYTDVKEHIESYVLLSHTSTYAFYMYFDSTKANRYYLIGIVNGCSAGLCSNIKSIQILD